MLSTRVHADMVLVRPSGQAVKIAGPEAQAVLEKVLAEVVGQDNIVTVQLPTPRGGYTTWFSIDATKLDVAAAIKLHRTFAEAVRKVATPRAIALALRTGTDPATVQPRRRSKKKEKKEKAAVK